MTIDINWSANQTLGQFFKEVGQTGGYWEMVLVFEFFLILLVGSSFNKKTTGFTNLVTWMEISALTVFVTGVLLMLGSFISAITLGICFVIMVAMFIISEIGNKVFGDNSGI